MDENSAIIEQILREDELQHNAAAAASRSDGAWQTVSHRRKSSKQPHSVVSIADRRSNGTADVFQSIDQQSEDRHRRIMEARNVVTAGGDDVEGGDFGGSKRISDDDDDSDRIAEVAEVKKVKQKKPKKVKVTVAEAAAKIDHGELGAFLVDISGSFEKQQDIQLMRFADYFGRAFAGVSSSQFPWLKIFRESSVSKMLDIPLSHISEDVYKTSVDWLGQRSVDALGSFVLWSLDSIFTDLASHQGAVKGKKAAQPPQSKSLVAIFVVLAMVLRRKPDVMVRLLPMIKETPKYQGQDKLPIFVWIITQASQGLYMWAHVLLPMLNNKSNYNPQARDLILQLVERILSAPKARSILINGAVRKGERVVPPSALELLMRFTFPAASNRVKATERFEAIYPTLKEISLAGSPGSKAMKQVAQEMLSLTVKAVGEGVSELSKEASDVFVWCLNQNAECYKQWDILYLDNLEASIVFLRKLSKELNDYSNKHSICNSLRETLESFRQKNEKALAETDDSAKVTLLKDADKSCKLILGRLSQGHGWIKGLVIVSAAVAVFAIVISQNPDSLDVKKLIESIHSQ